MKSSRSRFAAAGASALLAVLVLVTPAPTRAAEGPESVPVSARALYFRIEAGVEPAKVITGYLDESRGTGMGYDLAVCDLDGDGKPDYRGSGTVTVHLEPGQEEEYQVPAICFDHAGKTWGLSFETHHGEVEFRPDGAAELIFEWEVSQGESYVWFINGTFRAYRGPEAAAKARPVRIGPPFHWVTGARTRGPSALVTAALDDENGARLRIAARGDEDVRASLRIISGSGPDEELLGDYG